MKATRSFSSTTNTSAFSSGVRTCTHRGALNSLATTCTWKFHWIHVCDVSLPKQTYSKLPRPFSRHPDRPDDAHSRNSTQIIQEAAPTVFHEFFDMSGNPETRAWTDTHLSVERCPSFRVSKYAIRTPAGLPPTSLTSHDFFVFFSATAKAKRINNTVKGNRLKYEWREDSRTTTGAD